MEIQDVKRVNTGNNGSQANGHTMMTLHSSISADGKWVVFETDASNLVENDNNGSSDVFLKNIETGVIINLSVNDSGQIGNDDSTQPSISADGNLVVFSSEASNLVDGDTNNTADIFMFDLRTGTLSRLSLSYDNGNSNGRSVSIFDRVISGDNRYVVFESLASNLVEHDSNNARDIFVRDLLTSETTRVSLSTAGWQASDDSSHASISRDGRLVAFQSLAPNLSVGDNNDRRDIFVKDLATGELILASSNAKGVIANGESKYPTMSANGRFVAFQSSASNLVAGDTNGVEDVFVKDLLTGETTLVSVGLNGQAGANGFSLKPRLSADGRFVFFHSAASNLVAGDTNNAIDVFARDMATGETHLVSVGENGEQGNGRSLRANISDDGRVVVFESLASNLVPHDHNGDADLFSVTIAWEELSLLGDGGDDVLAGTPYGEYINAGFGDDQVSAGWGNDTVYATGGHDWVRGEEGDDFLHGGWGDDTLYGGTGNDTLLGLADSDSLIGGGGDDLFRFNETTTSDEPDVVADFQGAGEAPDDLIDLEVIDADLTAANDQAFQAPVLANAFTGIGQLILIQSGDDTIIRGNTDADLSTAEIEIILQGVQADQLSAADFLL